MESIHNESQLASSYAKDVIFVFLFFRAIVTAGTASTLFSALQRLQIWNLQNLDYHYFVFLNDSHESIKKEKAKRVSHSVVSSVPFRKQIRDKTATFLSRSKSRPVPENPAEFRPDRPGSVPGVPFRVKPNDVASCPLQNTLKKQPPSIIPKSISFLQPQKRKYRTRKRRRKKDGGTETKSSRGTWFRFCTDKLDLAVEHIKDLQKQVKVTYKRYQSSIKFPWPSTTSIFLYQTFPSFCADSHGY